MEETMLDAAKLERLWQLANVYEDQELLDIAQALRDAAREPQPSGAGEGLDQREQIAKALWNAEVAENARLGEKYAAWPEDAARQPYCQSTYRAADAVLAALRHSTSSAPDYAPVAKKLAEYMKAISKGTVDVHPNQIELFLEREMETPSESHHRRWKAMGSPSEKRKEEL